MELAKRGEMGTQFRVSSDQVERASSAISEQGVFVFDSAVAPAVVTAVPRY